MSAEGSLSDSHISELPLSEGPSPQFLHELDETVGDSRAELQEPPIGGVGGTGFRPRGIAPLLAGFCGESSQSGLALGWGGPLGVPLRRFRREPFSVDRGFDRTREGVLRDLAESLYGQAQEWPFLKGIRFYVRVYRFVSIDEPGLDLVRVELKVPGVDASDRVRLWTQLRNDLEKAISETKKTVTLVERRTLAALEERLSTSVVP